MNSKLEHTVFTGQLEDGAYIAYSQTSPYFCFEAASEHEALSVASRALNYYFGIEGSIERPASHTIERKLTGVVRKRSHRVEVQPAYA